jgi:hypothetical protein
MAPETAGSDEAFCVGDEVGLKQTPVTNGPGEQRGRTMLTIILNSIYRQFLRSSLPGMRRVTAS